MFETRSLRLSVCGIDWPLKPRCRRSMLTRFLEDTAFGPDEIAIMVAAYEVGLTQINANDPTAETLAQTIVMLAKQGERDPPPPPSWPFHGVARIACDRLRDPPVKRRCAKMP